MDECFPSWNRFPSFRMIPRTVPEICANLGAFSGGGKKKVVLCKVQKCFAMLCLVPFVKCFIGSLSLSVVCCMFAKCMVADFSTYVLCDLVYL